MRHARTICDTIARQIDPPSDAPPADWAAEHVVVPARESSLPGPIDLDYLPWTRAILNLRHDRPDKRGAVVLKRSQVGVSLALMAWILHGQAVLGGPALYVLPDQDKAKDFSDRRFGGIVAGDPRLAELAKAGVRDERDVMQTWYFGPSGRVDFVGAGTPGGMSSNPYRDIVLDEYEEIERNFPAQFGDPHEFSTGRVASYPYDSFLVMLSHPTIAGVGIDRVYAEKSDLGSWVFDCPHCGAVVRPAWDLVRFEHDGMGRAIADSAVFACGSCGAAIDDEQRRAAVWPRSDRHPRGTGRFAPGVTIDGAEAAKRPYAGVAVHGLVDPRVSLAELARMWAACASEHQRQGFLNTKLGEPFRPAKVGLTIDALKAAPRAAAVLPGGPQGVRMIACGVDVQHPVDNPTFYLRVVAYAPGLMYSLGFERVGGAQSWEALRRYVREYRAMVRGPSGLETPWGIDCLGIDHAGNLAREVLAWCRVPTQRFDGRAVRLVPTRFTGTLPDDRLIRMATEAQRTDPERPWMGLIDAYELARNAWVDREVRAWMAGSYVVTHPMTDEMTAHLAAQVQVPARKKTDLFGESRFVWERPPNTRDDWMTAGCYALAAAMTSYPVGDGLKDLAAIDPIDTRAGLSPRVVGAEPRRAPAQPIDGADRYTGMW
jgi:hypothetical protein